MLDETAKLLDPKRGEVDEGGARVVVREVEQMLLGLNPPGVFQPQEMNYGRVDAHRRLHNLLRRWLQR